MEGDCCRGGGDCASGVCNQYVCAAEPEPPGPAPAPGANANATNGTNATNATNATDSGGPQQDQSHSAYAFRDHLLMDQ